MKLRTDKIRKYPFLFLMHLAFLGIVVYLLVFIVGKGIQLDALSPVLAFREDKGLQMVSIVFHSIIGLVLIGTFYWILRSIREFFFSSSEKSSEIPTGK